MRHLSFYQTRIYVSFYLEEIHYFTTHKHSTETEINASRLINKFYRCYA